MKHPRLEKGRNSSPAERTYVMELEKQTIEKKRFLVSMRKFDDF